MTDSAHARRRLLVLASQSPRRASILETLGIPFETHPAAIDERVLGSEVPEAHVERLARAKAAAVASLRPDRPVLAGDTVVTRAGEILGKPRDDDHAVDMLLSLQGREHEVLSSLALARGSTIGSGVQRTRVRFRSFDESTARAYVATGEPADKAGSYGIQGLGAVLVEEIHGDYSAIVGLPVPLLLRLLAEAGMAYRFPTPPGGFRR